MSRRPAIKCVITLTACANKAHRVAQPLESSAKVHELYFFVTLISAIENTSLGGLDGPRRERSHPVRLRLLQQQKLATAFTHGMPDCDRIFGVRPMRRVRPLRTETSAAQICCLVGCYTSVSH